MFTMILERADGLTQRRKIGKQSPGSLKIRWSSLTVLALMIWSMGRGYRRDKRLIAASTNRLLERTDGVPARGTEEGHRVGAECMATGHALHRQHKSDGLTAPSHESI